MRDRGEEAMGNFINLEKPENISQTIHDLFDMDLAIAGAWGYTREEATIIQSIANDMPRNQLQHMLITMRSHLEMNIMQKEEERYGAINANEIAREEIQEQTHRYDKVTYKVTAMKEDLYKTFIKEYKKGYENGLDLSEHFKKREEATLVNEVVYYFEVGALSL